LKSPKAKITRYQNWKERHTTNVVASAVVVGEYKNTAEEVRALQEGTSFLHTPDNFLNAGWETAV